MLPKFHPIRKISAFWVSLCLNDGSENVNDVQWVTEIIENLSGCLMRSLLLLCFPEEAQGEQLLNSKECIRRNLLLGVKQWDNSVIQVMNWKLHIQEEPTAPTFLLMSLYIYYQHISTAAVMKSSHDLNILCIFQIKWKKKSIPPSSDCAI